jgi:hypothetical protein
MFITITIAGWVQLPGKESQSVLVKSSVDKSRQSILLGAGDFSRSYGYKK